MSLLYFWVLPGIIGMALIEMLNFISSGKSPQSLKSVRDFFTTVAAAAFTGWLSVGVLLASISEAPPLLQRIALYAFVALLLTACATELTKTRVGCRCEDGTFSAATGAGACSWHGGVDEWEYVYWWE